MIPVRLSVKNFLCYRENVPTLDFTGIHLACLCGPNGHGKSALLDAITWCLWGKARGRTQDDLIAYGADEARVELEFLARDTSYRVIRSHSRAGGRRRQGFTDLQLQVLSGDDAQPITGNVIRETQAKIDHTVGMDYDTFINSAFLLQGRADEFTSKTPADRKAVLASILGLETYDRLQELARNRLEQGRTAGAQLEGALESMRREAENIGEPSGQLEEVTVTLDTLNLKIEENGRRVYDLKTQVADLGKQRDRLADLQKRMEDLDRDIAQLERDLESAKNRVRQSKELIDQEATIQQGADSLTQAKHRFDSLEQARSQFEQLGNRENELVRTIEVGRSRLEAEVDQLRHRVEFELTPKAQSEQTVLSQLKDAQRRVDALAGESKAILAHRDHLSTVATGIGEAQSAAERYLADGKELRTKQNLLTSTGPQEAVCPLCQTPLGQDGCGRLAEVYRIDIEEKLKLYRENEARLKELEADKANLEGELTRREQALAGTQQQGQAEIQTLDLKLKESRQAQQDLGLAASQLDAALASLESGEHAAAEQQELKSIQGQIEALGYSEDARRKSYEEARSLQRFEEMARRLAQAQADIPQEEESVARAEQMLQRLGAEREQAKGEYRTGQEAIVDLPLRQKELQEAEVSYASVEKERQEATSHKGYLEGQVKRRDALRTELSSGLATLRGMREDEGIYQELVTAFGRQGIQAMLIETVVPRLEDEANNLLGRMTDNRMHLKLETQRERRTGKGDPIETLEINVTDEFGPRSYEMYSGGEAFRINLALRIALSKVLAQRMGAPLPVLFIDEGFGSQDSAGRERILDVIGAIQNDFEKIIVITHLDDMKDVFPVRIEVQKGEMGSTFWLS
ncbi:MAG: SMC family ATPase [Chloroflexi bacterium]|nr:SMC family ATPase [Chloroflexota bacterium]